MPEYIIAGVPVSFPFEPYDVQKDYMEKVITCLRDGTNGVLESPTGTGKTLSLLCSSLAWLVSQKAKMQASLENNAHPQSSIAHKITNEIAFAEAKRNNWGLPKIIYASRTHSQLTQAMQELKRTEYSYVRAVVLGSRDQLCIHPEVMREQGNSNKVQLCKIRVQTRTCSFYNRIDSKKDHPDLRVQTVMDIEDLIKTSQRLKVCPYYASKELVSDADITFMPYNYLIDPTARKANKVDLNNTIILLDEAHNIEKICEESASVQIRSTDIAVAIDDCTHIMKTIMNEHGADFAGDEEKDFSLEDLVTLKEMLLNLEKVVDDIVVDNIREGTTYPASYMFDVLAKANLTYDTMNVTISLLEKLVQYLAVETQGSAFRKGASFENLICLLKVVFVNKDDALAKVLKCFKMHVEIEEPKQKNDQGRTTKDPWMAKSTAGMSKAKIINYWCFNPGFGMEQLLNINVRSIILTSGTLAPLKPLIAELAIPIAQQLENPHIVGESQVFVRIIGSGPDREQLISNYANRDNPKYVSSLGQTILNVSRIVPDGLLVFFPSYPLLNQCVDSWQASGLWSEVSRHKPIFVEPRNKETFTKTMEEFYQNIRESKGACFLAVCRGKVSEGLDFADRNGRAVIITGLPFPPLKDPKVILKRRYLEDNRTKENELLSGQAWYSLEGTRAVNQAIGRVIRHRHDYGAILFCDVRFEQPVQVAQLSQWVRRYLGPRPKSSPFGAIVRDLREFFKTAEKTLPKPKDRSVEMLVNDSCEEAGIVRSRYFADPKLMLESKTKFQNAHTMATNVEKANSIVSWTPDEYKSAAGWWPSNKAPSAMDFMSRLNSNVKAIDFNDTSSSNGTVRIHKRERNSPTSSNNSTYGDWNKKKRYKLVNNPPDQSSKLSQRDESTPSTSQASLRSGSSFKEAPQDRIEFLTVLRRSLKGDEFNAFTAALVKYNNDDNFEDLMEKLLRFLGKPELLYMLRGMRRYLKTTHKELFDERLAAL